MKRYHGRAIVAISVSLFLTFIAPSTSAAGTISTNEIPGGAINFNSASIGRLMERKRFLCTAFIVRSEPIRTQITGQDPVAVISERIVFRNTIVSAGHCWNGREMHFVSNPFKLPDGQWTRAERFTVTVMVFSFMPHLPARDYLIGIFWSSHQMPTLNIEWGEPRLGEKLLTMGYPRSTLRSVVGQYIGRNEHGHMVINAIGQFGMSGSPIINERGRVVGIMTALRALYLYPMRIKRIPPMFGTPISLIRKILP